MIAPGWKDTAFSMFRRYAFRKPDSLRVILYLAEWELTESCCLAIMLRPGHLANKVSQGRGRRTWWEATGQLCIIEHSLPWKEATDDSPAAHVHKLLQTWFCCAALTTHKLHNFSVSSTFGCLHNNLSWGSLAHVFWPLQSSEDEDRSHKIGFLRNWFSPELV